MSLLIKMLIQYFESFDQPTRFFHKILSDHSYGFITKEQATLAIKSYVFALREHNLIIDSDYDFVMERLNNYNSLRLSKPIDVLDLYQ